MNDSEAMQLALAEGERARLHAPPNPWVGCIIVKDGTVIGRGHTQPPGGAHAEIMALEEAGPAARGAVVYVTLEPCSHHGRTPPCVKALIAAGVSRVVVGVTDPDPNVSGKGIAALRDAGIEVIEDVGETNLEPYLHHRRSGRPWVVGKIAGSIDGRTAAADGTSQWITCPQARRDVHRLRAQSQAVLVGSGTALADNPALTARDVPCPNQPLRVLVDRRGRVSAEGPLFDTTLAPTLVCTGSDSRRVEWEEAGCDVVTATTWPEILDELGSRGVIQLLVEGGSTVLGSLAAEGFINELVIYLGPCLLGGEGKPLIEIPVPTLSSAPKLTLNGVERLGESIRLDYALVNSHMFVDQPEKVLG